VSVVIKGGRHFRPFRPRRQFAIIDRMANASDVPTLEHTPSDPAATLTANGVVITTPREAPSDFAPPGYEIHGELGRGGMGVVYRARQIVVDRPVALKVILGAAHAGPDQLARFRAEATAAARLQHPNIVQIFEVGEHAGTPFFSLELVEGGSLADHLRGEPQPPRKAAEIVRSLATAVEHAHSRGIVHRDLKPANVLLAGGVPKVTDFGLAKQVTGDSKLTQSGAILGTPSYMAPEQAAGNGATVGPAADVYALGAILYECLTGRPPFRAAAVMDTVIQVVFDDPIPPSRLQPKLPRDLETICLKCLAKTPEQRYPSAAELAADLDRFLNGEPVRARPTAAVVKWWKWARRHPARAIVLFILAVPLPALLAVMIYLWADARSAWTAAEQEKTAAIEARDRADYERDRAEGYLRNALGAMEKVVDRVSDGPLSRLPDAQEERTGVLNDAIAFYETLLRLDTTDPAIRFDTAMTYHRMSRLGTVTGRIEQSEQMGRSAVQLLTDLMSEHPDRPAYRNELARTRMFLGHARLLVGDYDGAIAEYRQATEVIDAVVREYPAEPAYRTTAAECQQSLGYYYMTQRPTEGEQHFKEALRLADGVYAERPDADSRALLANILGAYGQFLVMARRPAEAEPVLNRAMTILDPKAGPPPAGGHARLNFDQAQSSTRFGLAVTYAMSNRSKQADGLIREVVRDFEGLLAGQPRAFPYRMQAVQAYMFFAQLAERTKHYPDAVKASGRAMELIDVLFHDYPVFLNSPKGHWLWQIRQILAAAHARNLLNVGKTTEAARTADELDPQQSGWTGTVAYDVGCVFALLAGGAEGSVREEYVGKAMTWLKKAHELGFPPTAQQVEYIRTKDVDMKAIRGRPEFQEWIKTLKPAKEK
jgi:eukaryotic-like serine/threonine-protein kinase